MKSLSSYLENIAYNILEPIDYLYAVPGKSHGMWGYLGIHSCKSNDPLWSEWTLLTTIEVMTDNNHKVVDEAKVDATRAKYGLYWTRVDNQQCSWWVEMIPDNTSNI